MRSALVACVVAGCWGAPAPKEPTPPKDLVQPVKIEKVEEGDPNGVEGGEEGGEEGGVVGGVVGGDLSGAPPPPPPPPPPAPQNVPPTLLEGFRISGEKNIVPNDMTKMAIMQSGRTKIVGSWKLCVNDQGNVKGVNNLKSTGYPDYDSKIEKEMWVWKYRPYVVNGKNVPVCTAVTFIYSQTAPSPTPPPP